MTGCCTSLSPQIDPVMKYKKTLTASSNGLKRTCCFSSIYFTESLGKLVAIDDAIGGKRLKGRLKNVVICHILVWVGVLDGEIEPAEVVRCLRSLKNNETGGGNGLEGALLKYGRMGMVDLSSQLFCVV